jgi:hypothetical protein
MDEEEIKRLLNESEQRVNAQAQPVRGGSNQSPFFHNRDKNQIGIKGGAPYIDYFGNKMEFNVPDMYVDYSKERTISDARASMQGLSLKTSDEIEAFLTSLGSDKNYSEILPEVREKINNYRTQNPNAALTSELLGAMITGPAMVGKTGTGSALRVVGSGGVVGLAGSDPESVLSQDEMTPENILRVRTEGGAFGTMFSLPFGFLAKVLQPSQFAKNLQDKGVKVTPGMMAEGDAQAIENILEQLPFGTGITKAKIGTLVSFNKMAYRELLKNINDALLPVSKSTTPLAQSPKPINNIEGIKQSLDQLLKMGNKQKGLSFDKFKLANGDGTDNFRQLDKIYDDVYDKLLTNITIRNKTGIQEEISTFLTNNVTIKNFDKKIENILFKRFDGENLTGKSLKQAQKQLRTNLRKATLSTADDSDDLANGYKGILDILRKQIAKDNPNIAQQYFKFDATYPKLLALQNAKQLSKRADGYFTPDNLIAGGNKVARSGSTKAVALDKAFLSQPSKQAKDLGVTDEQNKINPYYLLGALPFIGGAYGGREGDMGDAIGGAAKGLLAPLLLSGGYRIGPARDMMTQMLRGGTAQGASPFLSDRLRNRIFPRNR